MAHWWTANLALIRGTQVINGASAGVRTVEEGAVRGYAQQKKAQCVGTQCDRGSGAEEQ